MNRNYDIISHILKYCNDIDDSIEYFGKDYEVFCNNKHYQNDISMCIFQIGELAGHLTEEYKEQTKSTISWKAIRGMRNLFAHAYHNMRVDEIWKTAIENIQPLKDFCVQQLETYNLMNQNSVDPMDDEDYDMEM